MRGPLRTDRKGLIHAYFQRPTPRPLKQVPAALGRQPTWLFYGIIAAIVVTAGGMPLLGWLIDEPQLAGMGALLLLAGAVFVVAKWKRHHRGGELLQSGTLTVGRITDAEQHFRAGSGSSGGTAWQTLALVFRRSDGAFAKGALRLSEWPLFIETAKTSLCYVAYGDDGRAGLVVPGYGVEPFDPSPADALDDDFSGVQELEPRIRETAKIWPPWHRIAIPVTAVFGLFFLMSFTFDRPLLWTGNYILLGVWLAAMAPLVRLRQLMRDKPRLGSDGLVLRGHYLPFRRIAALQRGGVLCDDGKVLRFWGEQLRVAEIYALASEYWEAYLHCREPKSLRALEPAERYDSEWTADLRELLARGSGDFRSAGPSREDLWKLAESPCTPPTMRAAAAVALSVDPDADDAERWTKLAERTACPALRRLFEEVVRDGSADSLAAALGRVRAADGAY